MAEGGGENSVSREATSCEAVGGRQRFRVKLSSGETTIVSWKKLIKDATASDNIASTSSSSSKPKKGPSPAHPAPPPPSPTSHPSLDARLAPDEYSRVDNARIKHEGFFGNRGKLDCIEPTLLPHQQLKKQKRKELAKDHSGDVRLNLNKHPKESSLMHLCCRTRILTSRRMFCSPPRMMGAN